MKINLERSEFYQNWRVPYEPAWLKSKFYRELLYNKMLGVLQGFYMLYVVICTIKKHREWMLFYFKDLA